jgi:hypothetical protein
MKYGAEMSSIYHDTHTKFHINWFRPSEVNGGRMGFTDIQTEQRLQEVETCGMNNK